MSFYDLSIYGLFLIIKYLLQGLYLLFMIQLLFNEFLWLLKEISLSFNFGDRQIVTVTLLGERGYI